MYVCVYIHIYIYTHIHIYSTCPCLGGLLRTKCAGLYLTPLLTLGIPATFGWRSAVVCQHPTWGTEGTRHGSSHLPSGKLTELWKITIFNGKIHYKWSFSIAMLNYQRVLLFWGWFTALGLPTAWICFAQKKRAYGKSVKTAVWALIEPSVEAKHISLKVTFFSSR